MTPPTLSLLLLAIFGANCFFAQVCPNGRPAATPCATSGFACPVGLSCVDGQCCRRQDEIKLVLICLLAPASSPCGLPLPSGPLSSPCGCSLPSCCKGGRGFVGTPPRLCPCAPQVRTCCPGPQIPQPVFPPNPVPVMTTRRPFIPLTPRQTLSPFPTPRPRPIFPPTQRPLRTFPPLPPLRFTDPPTIRLPPFPITNLPPRTFRPPFPLRTPSPFTLPPPPAFTSPRPDFTILPPFPPIPNFPTSNASVPLPPFPLPSPGRPNPRPATKSTLPPLPPFIFGGRENGTLQSDASVQLFPPISVFPLPAPGAQVPASARHRPLICPDGEGPVGLCEEDGTCLQEGVYSCVGGMCCASKGMCGENERWGGVCEKGQCTEGYTCKSGVCCGSGVVVPGLCADGRVAGASCIDGWWCGEGFSCQEGKLCCPKRAKKFKGVCQLGSPVARCLADGKCGRGYRCEGEGAGAFCCEEGDPDNLRLAHDGDMLVAVYRSRRPTKP